MRGEREDRLFYLLSIVGLLVLLSGFIFSLIDASHNKLTGKLIEEGDSITSSENSQIIQKENYNYEPLGIGQRIFGVVVLLILIGIIGVVIYSNLCRKSYLENHIE
jgi:hypothetical protein